MCVLAFLRPRPHEAQNIAQIMTGSMSGTCYIHVCEQATNMMVNLPSRFSFTMFWTQLGTSSKHYDSPHEVTRAQQAVTVHMSHEEDLLLAAAATVVICGYRHKSPVRAGKWTQGDVIIIKRWCLTMKHYCLNTSGSFSNFLRMSASDFEVLLTKIAPIIKKDRSTKSHVHSMAT